MAERIGSHGRDGHPGRGARPLQAQQLAHRAGPRAAPAEGGEVVGAEAGPRGVVHAGDVDGAGIPERVAAAQRIGGRQVVAYPIGVTPPERGEPGVEAVRGAPDRAHPDVGRQQPGEPAGDVGAGRRPGGRRHVQVGHLAACVNPGVGPGLLDHLLDGPQARLAAPAVEA